MTTGGSAAALFDLLRRRVFAPPADPRAAPIATLGDLLPLPDDDEEATAEAALIEELEQHGQRSGKTKP